MGVEVNGEGHRDGGVEVPCVDGRHSGEVVHLEDRDVGLQGRGDRHDDEEDLVVEVHRVVRDDVGVQEVVAHLGDHDDDDVGEVDGDEEVGVQLMKLSQSHVGDI